jgi:large subunit ribosomal protein L10
MRQEKQLLLDEIKGQLEEKPTFVLLSYASMASNVANAFRSEIAKSGGSVEIVRKRVLIKAAAETGVTLEKEVLEGHIGVVFAGDDAIETTKTIFTFSKDNGNVIKVVGGRYDVQCR